jgi:hypothetical protein
MKGIEREKEKEKEKKKEKPLDVSAIFVQALTNDEEENKKTFLALFLK